MKFFNFFKAAKTEQQERSIYLELLIKKAATEGAYRDALFRQLLAYDLFVIAQPSVQKGVVPEKINVAAYKDGKIPVFTSSQRIFDKKIVRGEVNYVKINGRKLFELLKGATFYLNPYSDYFYQVLPNEIEKLLGEVKVIEYQKGDKILHNMPELALNLQ
jgi:hypothetical protein